MDADIDDPEELKRTAAEWRRQLREDAQAMMAHVRGLTKPTDYLEACRAMRYFTLADQMICQTCRPLPDPAAEPAPQPSHTPKPQPKPSRVRPVEDEDDDGVPVYNDDDEDGWMDEKDDGYQETSRYYAWARDDFQAREARDREVRRGGNPPPFVSKYLHHKGYRAYLARFANRKIEAFRDAMLRRGASVPEDAWFAKIYGEVGLAVVTSADPPEASPVFETADISPGYDDWIYGPRGTDQHGNPVFAQKPP